MYQSSVRSATASPGKTALAIVAIFSLMLSLFAIARPVAADHSGFDHQPLPIDTSTFEEDAEECEGVELEPGQVLLHWIANQQNTTEAITLTLFLQGGGELTADSYKRNEPRNINSNVTHHFEFIVDADIVVEDLDISTGEGNVRLSHVCRADAEGEQPGADDDAALNIFKLIEGTTTRLPGAVFEIDGMDGTFVTDENGQICITGLPDDSEWLVREIQAPEGYEIIEAEQLVEVDDDGDCDSPDARFYNRPIEGEQPETSQVEIMKHLCPDVSTTDEFEAIEVAGRDEAGSTGLEENEDFAALAATVVNCPTIILSADVPMDEAPMAQAGEFEFTVLDANGEQVLSTDGLFVDDKLCETDISVDVDNNGSFDADVCLDTSYYRFEVVDGMVTITETVAPGEAGFFGTIRFTPGSGDEMALVGSIEEVEQSGGVITLDTTLDPDNSGEGTPDEYADDVIMVHVYNFTPAEGEQPGNPPGNGGSGPGQSDTPREGTAGGNPLPNTATTPAPGGSLPAILLALMALGALGVGGHRVATEARSRR